MKALFDHRRPITCADRRPIQYGEERKFAARSDGRRWWTPEEDRTLLRMRLGGASWGEISEALNRGGNYGGRTATFGNVTGRVRFLFNHEIKWGGRRPLPEDVRGMIAELKKRGAEISRLNRLRGTAACHTSAAAKKAAATRRWLKNGGAK